jgi:hypothetical protein
MSGAMIDWLISGLGWLKRAIGPLIALAVRYPWQAACALLLTAAAMLWRSEHRATVQRDAARTEAAQLRGASARAGQLAQAQRKVDEQHYKELANNADASHQAGAARAGRATADYLALHRMRAPAAARPAGAVAPETQSGGAGLPANPAADAFVVAVSEDDVRACSADYSYAVAAYEWAMSLGD